VKRSRIPLAVAMGVGAAAIAGKLAVSATKRQASRFRASDAPPAPEDAALYELDQLGVERRTIATHDGGELFVVEKGPADARPLVLLHGITLAARVWGQQLRDLSDRYRVVAVDLRGHGASTVGSDGFGLGPLARDLCTVLEALDLHDAVVVGHSMGGMALMRFCGDHTDVLDERVAGVVFLATAPVVPLPAAVQKALTVLSPRITKVGERRGWDRMPIYRFDDGDVSYLLARRAFGRSPRRAHVELTRQLVADAPPATVFPSGIGLVVHDAEEALAATRTPALVIGGELDGITPVAMSHRMAELLPDVELTVFPDAGHQLMLERPDELADLLDRFSARLASGAHRQDGTDTLLRTGP